MKRFLIAAPIFALTATAASANEPQLPAMAQSAPIGRPVSDTGVQVTGGQDSSSVSLQAGGVLSSRRKNSDVGVFETWALTATAPLDTSSSQTDVANLDGLANSASLEFRFTVLRQSGLLRGPNPRRAEICAEVNRRAGTPEEEGGKGCPNKAVAQYAPELLQEFLDLFWSRNASTLIAGTTGKVGRRSFDYYDAGTLVKLTDTRTPWSVGGFVSWQPPRAKYLITMTAQYQQSYDGADPQVRCPVGAAPIVCVSGAIGAPSSARKRLVSLEVRRNFGAFAIAPMVTHDFASDVTGVDLPVYLVKGDKGPMTGGVRVGWRSDTDAVTVGLFVGAPFSLFGGGR